MRFGPLTLDSNLFLSPLAGYTNLPFRLTVRELGGVGLATTDLVNARSLLEKKTKALKLIETSPADRPLAVQLFGSVPEEMRDAAVYLESLGIASADINMGCPVRKVCRVGGGSAMMTSPPPCSTGASFPLASVIFTVTANPRQFGFPPGPIPGVVKLIGTLQYGMPSEFGPIVVDGPAVALIIPELVGAAVLCIVNVQLTAETGHTPESATAWLHGATYSVQVSSASVGGYWHPVVRYGEIVISAPPLSVRCAPM